MTSLGYAEEYIVRLEDTNEAFAGNAKQLYDIPFTEISWQRTEGVSTSSVTVANDRYGGTCCPYPLHGWVQSIAIYRNGALVWFGPLVGWQSEGTSVKLVGRDVLSFVERSVILSDLTLASSPANCITDILAASDLYNEVMYQALLPAITDSLSSLWGWSTTISRTITAASRSSTWDAIQSVLAEANGVATAFGLYGMFGGRLLGVDAQELTVPVLDEHTTLSRPNIIVDCTNIASTVYAINDSSGVGGSPQIVNISADISEQDSGLTFSQLAYADKIDSPFFDVTTPLPLHMDIHGQPRMDDATSEIYAYNEAIQALAPRVTIEALQLSPTFGEINRDIGFRPFEGINSLIPGRFNVRWGFESSCLSEVPVAMQVSSFGSRPASSFHYSTSIRGAHLVQLDVTVSKTDGDLTEKVMASFIPTTYYPGQ